MTGVSVVVMTKNEEGAIERCLRALAHFETVFVVDSNSTDRTRAIAKATGAQVVAFTWNGRYPKKKQWCLENLPFKTDWVLFVDADEVVSPRLSDEIRRVVRNSQHAAFDARLDYYFLGERLRHGHRITKRILIDRQKCHFPVVDDLGAEMMWEVEGHYQPVADGTVGRLSGTLRHDDVDRLFDYFSRHNRYSDWEAHLAVGETPARELVNASRSAGGRRASRVPFKPLSFFLYAYVLRGGFLDGAAGFHYAVSQAFYYWQIAVKVRERQRDSY